VALRKSNRRIHECEIGVPITIQVDDGLFQVFVENRLLPAPAGSAAIMARWREAHHVFQRARHSGQSVRLQNGYRNDVMRKGDGGERDFGKHFAGGVFAPFERRIVEINQINALLHSPIGIAELHKHLVCIHIRITATIANDHVGIGCTGANIV